MSPQTPPERGNLGPLAARRGFRLGDNFTEVVFISMPGPNFWLVFERLSPFVSASFGFKASSFLASVDPYGGLGVRQLLQLAPGPASSSRGLGCGQMMHRGRRRARRTICNFVPQ